MVNQKETLEILNKDVEYEDKLAQDILYYCSMCKDDIIDLPGDVKEEIHELMDKIRTDSERHELMIKALIQMVLTKGEGDY